MLQTNRRRLLGAGLWMLALPVFLRTEARAAGTPGLTTHMLDTSSGKPAESPTFHLQ
jgi:hypothetical protein